MNEIRELFECELRLIEEKKGLPKYALAKLSYGFAEGDKKNLNARTYLEPLLQREIAKKNEEIRKGGILGQLDHPLDGNTKLSKASHVLSNLSYDKTSKIAFAESLILNTRAGKDFLVVLQTKPKIGASMRGWGNVSTKGIVQDDWKLSSIDFVLNPSFGDVAKIDATNLIESYEPEAVEDVKKTKKVKINERAIESLLKLLYSARVDEYGYDGSYEDFARQKRTLITAEYILQDYPDRFQNIEEALEYLGVPELLEKYHEENKEQRVLAYTVAEVFDEARQAGIHPQEMCDKLNENLKITTALNNAGITTKERQLMNEMRDAGATGTPMELLEKCRKIEQMQKVFKPNLTEEQKKAEDLKKVKEIREAKRARIIQQINKDVMISGGAPPEKVKELVHQALKEEGLLED